MFYVLFALSLYLPRRWQLPALLGVLLTLAGLGTIEFFTTPTLIGWTNPIIIDFSVGALIGHMWQYGWKMGRSFAVVTVGITILVAAAKS